MAKADRNLDFDVTNSNGRDMSEEDDWRSNSSSSSLVLPSYNYQCLIKHINDCIDSGTKFFSLEFFPPRTPIGASNLITICDRIAVARPLFCDVTWKVGGDNSSENPTSTLTVSSSLINYCGVNTMMHITCVGQTKNDIKVTLDKAKLLGIRNILALRGDLAPGHDIWDAADDGFTFSSDLVQFIHSVYGDYFVIAVAGYPTGHPDSASYADDLENLKKKVDAGADFVITQLFFEACTFLNFLKDCRRIGIHCPILPGILPIQAYQSLRNIAKLSKLEVPDEILRAIEPFKDDDEAVRRFGIDHCTAMCRQLLASGSVDGLHFYTLNREYATVQILKNLGMWTERPRRTFPWKPTANHVRCMEDVRPIFWNSRPHSYVYRTSGWDEFPNGRWGNSSSASFRDLNDHYLFYIKSRLPSNDLLDMWGRELTCDRDVWDVFTCYLSGQDNKQGFKVNRIPWNDESLSAETNSLVENLIEMNSHGVLTINSQPNINCAPSTDPVHGWGNPGGYVFQKAYLEFFTSKENVECLKIILKDYPNVNYHIVDNKHDTDYTNCHELQPIAVTWGIFPGKEVVQPTVVDPIAFKTWKGEAFDLWIEQWGKLYADGSRSRQVIHDIVDRYCLVNLVDNDFLRESSCLFEILEAMLIRRNNSSDGDT